MKKRLNRRGIAVLGVLILGLTTLSFKTNLFEVAKQLEIFTTLFKELQLNYVDETNPAELMGSAINNMLRELDPYTVYLNEQDAESYKMDQIGEYAGIGATVQIVRDKMLVLEVFEGMPADLEGLRAGDEIVSIDGIAVADLKSEALELLKGETNSKVAVTYKRNESLLNASVDRTPLEPKTVPFFGMADSKTGYIVLSRFGSTASEEVRDAVLSLKDSGAERLILDLRGNPGGLLGEAVNIVNLFIPKGELVVYTRSVKEDFNQNYVTRNEPLDLLIPLTILINGNSASASEIVAGSLQDLDRAVVLGAQSFGKGLVQRQLPLVYGTQLKVTISRYYTPSGRCIQALDYRNRDDEGKAKKKDSFNTFQTRNGRLVNDSGGIAPDIVIPSEYQNPLVRHLEENYLIFDFATAFHQTHDYPSLSDFKFAESDYADFLNFIKQRGVSIESEQESNLKKFIAQQGGTTDDVELSEAYKNLLLVLEKRRDRNFRDSEGFIRKALELEIVKRYVYRSGLYKYSLENDDAILSARELMEDVKHYASILK